MQVDYELQPMSCPILNLTTIVVGSDNCIGVPKLSGQNLGSIKYILASISITFDNVLTIFYSSNCATFQVPKQLLSAVPPIDTRWRMSEKQLWNCSLSK